MDRSNDFESHFICTSTGGSVRNNGGGIKSALLVKLSMLLRWIGLLPSDDTEPIWDGRLPPKMAPFVIEREFDLPWRLGARAGAALNSVAKRYQSRVELEHAGHIANLKDLMDLMVLSQRVHISRAATGGDVERIMEERTKSSNPEQFDLQAGAHVKVITSGADAEEAMAALARLFLDTGVGPK